MNKSFQKVIVYKSGEPCRYEKCIEKEKCKICKREKAQGNFKMPLYLAQALKEIYGDNR